MPNQERKQTVIAGAGPAGLTAAWMLARRGVRPLVLEQDNQVGGLARTVEYKGFRFDIGGHRFFTKVGSVQKLWRSMMGPEMLKRPRLSRIYYGGKFFDYPLKPMNALTGLGVGNSFLVFLSYLWIRLKPIRPEVSFEDWVSNRFGRRLYNIFFKTYTEKVWGIPCNRIGAQWAAQRIKGLSLFTAITSMLLKGFRKPGAKQIKTLIEEFEYPRLGPGMMWEAFHAEVERMGGTVVLQAPVQRIEHNGSSIVSIDYGKDERRRVDVGAFVSTMPLRELVQKLDPPPPEPVREAAARLNYRDFLTVALIIDTPTLFPDNWIYVHDSRVKLGRIQNFKNWSPDMVPDQSQTCLGLEVLLLRGGRALDDDRRGSPGPRRAGDRDHRAARWRERRRRDGRQDAEGLSGLRRWVHGCAGGPAGISGGLLQPAGGRQERHAQVQQPGPLHGDGVPGGGEPARRASRRLGRQRRR